MAKKASKRAKKKTGKSVGKGKRYSAQRKKTLLARYNELRAAGETTQAAAKKVGVPYITLRSWQKKAGGESSPTARRALKKAVSGKKGRSKAAAARPAAEPTGITLVTPNGYRIEGISPKELISVLRALR